MDLVSCLLLLAGLYMFARPMMPKPGGPPEPEAAIFVASGLLVSAAMLGGAGHPDVILPDVSSGSLQAVLAALGAGLAAGVILSRRGARQLFATRRAGELPPPALTHPAWIGLAAAAVPYIVFVVIIAGMRCFDSTADSGYAVDTSVVVYYLTGALTITTMLALTAGGVATYVQARRRRAAWEQYADDRHHLAQRIGRERAAALADAAVTSST